MLLKYLFSVLYILVVKSHECGKRKINSRGVVVGGHDSNAGDWPWHVAISHFIRGAFLYQCGGSIINTTTILTVAHCVYDNGRVMNKDRLKVTLGNHQLFKFSMNQYEHSVHEIIPHPEFNNSHYRNDIALLILNHEIQFTDYIQPVCLWDLNDDGVNKIGSVIGWGFDGNSEISATLKETKMPIVNTFTCIHSVPGVFGKLVNENNYCAGFRNGTGVCNGDSGSGMFFKVSGRWYLRGIVSQAIIDGNTLKCDLNEYVIFTDVTKYRSWIGLTSVIKSSVKSKFANHKNFHLLNNAECGINNYDIDEDENLKPIYQQYPWMVLVPINFLGIVYLRCNGFLISELYVVTTASCASLYTRDPIKLGDYNIRNNDPDCVGTHSGTDCQYSQTVSVEREILHPYHNDELLNHENDIALLRLSTKADLKRPNIKTVCLPLLDDWQNNQNMVITGFVENENILSRQLGTRTSCLPTDDSKDICININTESKECELIRGAALLSIQQVNSERNAYVLKGFATVNNCVRHQNYLRIKPHLEWILTRSISRIAIKT
uniref:Putative trypsin n=1 Tax=Corethrella appendiculata TaxID=1370023 RepID=U5EDK9_9DIPT